MSSKELVETALRVLVAWNEGRIPAPVDVEILRTGFPASQDLAIDDLACLIVHRLSGRVIQESELEERPPGLMDEVA